jgi:nitric oxide dioxygenase
VTPEQLSLVQASYLQVAPRADEVAAAFYDRLFALAPQVRPLFTTDPAQQRQKFLDELAAIVAAITDLDRLLERTRPLGERHAGYGVRPSHYEPVGIALVGALGDALGERFTTEVADAWEAAYQLVAETMTQAGLATPPR